MKVKNITDYKEIQDNKTTNEIPIATDESQVIMELNFNHYVSVLSNILVKYSTNFRWGSCSLMRTLNPLHIHIRIILRKKGGMYYGL